MHVVCLNAGVAPVGPMFDTPPEVWEWVFDVNVRGAFFMAQEVGKWMIAVGEWIFGLTPFGWQGKETADGKPSPNKTALMTLPAWAACTCPRSAP